MRTTNPALAVEYIAACGEFETAEEIISGFASCEWNPTPQREVA